MKLDLKPLADAIIEQLQKISVEKALLAFLGTATGVGFKAWLIKLAVKMLVRDVGDPLVRAGVIEVTYVVDNIKGDIQWSALKKAGNVQEYNDAYDDILGGKLR